MLNDASSGIIGTLRFASESGRVGMLVSPKRGALSWLKRVALTGAVSMLGALLAALLIEPDEGD